MKNQELISVLIPCYNAENYLDECLTGLLNQTYKNIEVIIVNDGSTDKSESIIDSYIKKFQRNDMKLIKINQRNGGQASACNNGLKYVKGEYLYWQDADDVCEKDGIEKLYNFLQNNHDFQIVRGNATYRKEESFDKIEFYSRAKNQNKVNLFNNYLFEKDTICFVGIFMVRMEYFDLCNPNRELYIANGGQNYQLLLPILHNGKCGYVNQNIYKYRIVSNSHSHSVRKLKDLFTRCDVHQKIIFNTFKVIKTMSKFEIIKYSVLIRTKYLIKKIIIILSKIKKILLG